MDFVSVETVEEALEALGRLGDDAAILAGGTALLYQLGAGLRPPCCRRR